MPNGAEQKFIELRDDLSFLTDYSKLKMGT
ncbi:hypothetical protein DHX103_03750 [Planococcus sp. X10-3]